MGARLALDGPLRGFRISSLVVVHAAMFAVTVWSAEFFAVTARSGPSTLSLKTQTFITQVC